MRLQGGERRLIEVNLDSDRLDLREMIGEGPIWRPGCRQRRQPDSAADGPRQNVLFAKFRDDDMRVTLRVGELLLPNIPAGRLDARFALPERHARCQQLDFAAAERAALNGKGRIEHVSAAPAGRVDFALSAATADSLRIAADLFGLPEDVSRSKHLSSARAARHQGQPGRRARGRRHQRLHRTGRQGRQAPTSSLMARALGDPAKLGEANIDIDGSVTGERPQAILVLLFPDLPVERLAAPAAARAS